MTPRTASIGSARAAIYIRVSTDRQTGENQHAELLQLAAARGFEPIIYEEVESAAKTRPVLDRMLGDVRAGRMRAILVWALDRLHRSMFGAVQTVLECDRIGVPVISVREPWLDTSGPVRTLLVAIFGWVAEQERARLIERTKAGLERARRSGTRSGKPIGRPPASAVMLHAGAERILAGEPARAVARELGLSDRTLRRFLVGHASPAAKPPAPGQGGGSTIPPGSS